MLMIAHRGASGWAPENTLPALKRAVELDSDMVELDVFACRTGEIVVIHDELVDRTTDGWGRVEDHSLADLQRLDAGGGAQIPQLQEVLDLLDKGSVPVPVNIEVKDDRASQGVEDIIRNFRETRGWEGSRFLVSSFNHPVLKRFHQRMPDIRIGALTGSLPLDMAAYAEQLGAWSANIDMDLICPEFVDDAHRRGLKVLTYTVNTREDLQRMAAMGVDGVFTNYPKLGLS